MTTGSGARLSVRTIQVETPTDDRMLDITKILGSGARSSDASTVGIEAVSSNMVLLKLLSRRRDLSDGTEEVDSALEVILNDDVDSDPIEHVNELHECL